MKSVSRIIVVIMLVSIMLPLALVNAQDGEGEDVALTLEPAGVFYLSAESGSFEDQGDGMYLLTLEGVADELTWILTEPNLFVYTLSNATLSEQWGAAATLETSAALQAGDLNIVMTISSPTYDLETEVLTFEVMVDEIVAADEKDPELPMTFDNADLSYAWSVDFQNGLVEGIVAIFEGVRATPEECQTAQEEWNDFSVWRQQKQQEIAPLQMNCFFMGNQAACTQMNAISAEISAREAAITPLVTILWTECN